MQTSGVVRPIVAIGPAGVLLVLAAGGVFAAGCSQTRVVRAARPAPVTIVMTQPQPAPPTAAVAPSPPQQAAPPPVVNNVVEQSPARNVSPPAYGVTEAQSERSGQAEQVVASASEQIERLNRIQRSESNAAPREDVDRALGDLESKRETVLQDMRELAIQPTADVFSKLSADVARLRGAVRTSYAIAPPPSQGLPPPSPLPPSLIH